jgi:L-lysine exporter family protein LysE/ArgO
LDLRLFLRGVVFGLGAAVPIGPVNVEIARRTLRCGFPAGFFLGCGAVTIDVCFAVLAAIGVTPLLSKAYFYWPLAAAGFGLLVFMGVSSLAGARQAARADLLSAGATPQKLHSTRGSYLTGLAMTGLNPFTWAFWFVVLPQVAGTIAHDPARDLPIICTGVFAGTIAWVVCFTSLLSFAGRFRRRWWLVLADEFGGVLLLWFAAALLLNSLHRLYDPSP